MTRSNPTDADLVRAAQRGDDPAIEALTERWWPRIRRWALVELGDPSLADDGAQESLVRVLRLLGSCDPERPFGSWLRRLVRNACLDLRQKRGLVLAFEAEPARLARLDRAHDLRAGAARAREAFCALSPRQRQAIELCDHQGMSAVEAATELGVEPGTVRALLHQGRRALRAQLIAHRPELVALLREAE